jgi:hypothetical protein
MESLLERVGGESCIFARQLKPHDFSDQRRHFGALEDNGNRHAIDADHFGDELNARPQTSTAASFGSTVQARTGFLFEAVVGSHSSTGQQPAPVIPRDFVFAGRWVDEPQ